MVKFVSQLSLTVGLPKTGTAPVTHSLVRLGWQLMMGGMVSRMVMICRQLAELVQSSMTVCVRKMVPPQGPPKSGLSVHRYSRSPSQLSLALPPMARNSARVVGRAGTSLWHCTLVFAGHTMTGGMVSRTV